MAITLTKTLQTVEYDLYIKSSVIFLSSTVVVLDMKVYESQGHYTDGFVAMIGRMENITHVPTIASFSGSYASTVGLAAAEAWLVANVAWYSGGVVV